MEKRIYNEDICDKVSISRNGPFIELNNKVNNNDERYLLLYSFINEYQPLGNFPFFMKVLDLLYAYFPTWSTEECITALKYVEIIIKDEEQWQYFFSNLKYEFIDLFFNEFET